MLVSLNCRVTLITAQPPLSAAESTHISAFLTAYPAINTLDFQLIPYTPPDATNPDPFFIQYEAMRRSVHLLAPLLSSTSPPLSAIFSDIAGCGGVSQLADDLNLPHYILSTTSARFTTLVFHLPSLTSPGNAITTTTETTVQIPGFAPFETSTIPPPFFTPNHIFTNNVISTSLALKKATGILSNTFRAFEPETIKSLNNPNFKSNFPPFFPIGPLEPHGLQVGDHQPLSWLDQQQLKSVVYVSFGNRTALSKDQITELGNGLVQSGWRFLWVLKLKMVDNEDTEEFEELMGDSFIKRMKEKGMVVKGWVDQKIILSHPAIGGFVSHCGWNSVMEAGVKGVPVVAWPQNGDQKVNAGIVEKGGVGIKVGVGLGRNW